MAIREIRQIGEEILEKKSRPVEVFDQRLWNLLDDMYESMVEKNGVGIAAPQVGVLRRVVVIDAGDGRIEMINPQIINEEGSIIGIEGCLSVVGTYGDVDRPKKVKAKALDRNGKEFIIEGEGLLARAICHETDHLEGILFVEKVIRFIDPEESEND